VGVDPEDVSFLRRRVAELRAQYADLTFPSAPGALHGDAHIQNLIKTPSGQAVLIDFERFAFGPREIDLSTTACERDLEWHSAAEYKEFCDAYGLDVTTWDGFAVLRDINHLKMTTWLMQNVNEGRDVAAEFQTRLASLKGVPTGNPWKPF
jgi:thiamine kinase-like enzyme